tara:strand:- start:532 stop:978 length:447 start_codon:yes stop_codon:yes gene_type:complete
MFFLLLVGIFSLLLVIFFLKKISNSSFKNFKLFLNIIILFLIILSCFLLYRVYPSFFSFIPAAFWFFIRWRSVILFIKNFIFKKKENRNFSSSMSRDEALRILGLNDGATKEDIIAAYRKQIKKNHPDLGGSDWVTSRINKAKETLLN